MTAVGVGPAVLRTVRDVSVGSSDVVFAAGVASAALGLLVATLAYRGYARHGSRRMLFLSVGVVLLTTVPFVLSYGIAWASAATDAQVLASVTATNVAGLAAIAISLRGGPA
ncbi:MULTISPECIES: hypothetical protein [Halostella]|uniref:DUF7521 family protein n=1 Tax=Halostella TaxID=1843185 RepID=UPI001F2A0E1F|nr:MULTISPECIES: hypothetical protein [Halostella]